VPVLGPGEGERLDTETRAFVIKGDREELSINEVDAGPDFEGVGPHYHERHVDAFYIVEGELEFLMDGETVRAGAGTSVVVPPGVVHSFQTVSPQARYINIHAPDAGFLEFMRARHRGEDPAPTSWDNVPVD
jgi:mannose-6-phosphate isomerase-like protein (cupin superfamily)